MDTTLTTDPSQSVERGWRRLDPLTRLVISVGTLIAAALLDGLVCLMILGVLAVIVPAATTGIVRRVLGTALLLALPLAISVVVVNVLFSIDGTVVAEIGPLTVTREGVDLAIVVSARVLTMAGAAVLFYATTTPSRLVASLRSHGMSARTTFVIHNGVAMIPRLMDRAREVSDAQQARGLDTKGTPWRRARGVMALAAPTVLGAIGEVEARTLALETRGFSRPGRPTILWTPNDGPWQRLVRWGIAAGLVVLVLARTLGLPLPC